MIAAHAFDRLVQLIEVDLAASKHGRLAQRRANAVEVLAQARHEACVADIVLKHLAQPLRRRSEPQRACVDGERHVPVGWRRDARYAVPV